MSNNTLLAGAIFNLALVLAGCGGLSIPLNKTQIIPTGVADNADKLVSKLNAITKDTPYVEVMKQLNITRKTPNVGDVLMAKEKQELLYGSLQIIASTPEAAEDHRDKMERTRIKSIRLVMTSRPMVLDSPISASFPRTGESLIAYLIFFDDKFVRLIIPDNYVVDEKERKYITDPITGAFSGAAGRGLSQIK
ncbi:MAG: hypothetical protein HYT98_01040 [Candidatus Sungbacteria bacterium]|nr:hypothetical protein [Candidatus Sungbacteria bacterium]